MMGSQSVNYMYEHRESQEKPKEIQGEKSADYGQTSLRGPVLIKRSPVLSGQLKMPWEILSLITVNLTSTACKQLWSPITMSQQVFFYCVHLYLMATLLRETIQVHIKYICVCGLLENCCSELNHQTHFKPAMY